MKYTLLILSVFAVSSSFAQLTELKQLQEYRTKVKNYLKSENIDSAEYFGLKTINSKTYTNAVDFLQLAHCSIEKNEINKFKKYLDEGIKRGADSALIKIYMRKISASNVTYLNKYLENDYPINYAKFRKTIDTVLLNYMDDIRELDQYVRKDFKKDTNMIYRQQFGRIADSVNFVRVKDLIESGNYPGFHSVGIGASDYTIILYHITDTNEEDFEYIFSFMKEQVLKGDMTPEEVKGFVTRHYYFKKKCNYYGVQQSYNPQVSNAPLCNCNEVDNYRNEIGYESLAEYYETENVELPDCYKKR